MKYVFKFSIIIFVCVIGLVSYKGNVSAATYASYASEFDKTCAQICAENSQVCQNISTADDEVNYSYCGFNENEECANIEGYCSTIFENTYLTCFDRITNAECGADLNKYLNWTNCNCDSVIKSQLVSGDDVAIPTYRTGEQRFATPLNYNDAVRWNSLSMLRVLLYNWGGQPDDIYAQVLVACDLSCDLWGNPEYFENQSYLFCSLASAISTTTYENADFNCSLNFEDGNENCNICGFQIVNNAQEISIAIADENVDEQYFFPDTQSSSSVYSAYYQLFGTTSTTPETYCACNTGNFFQNGICNAFCYLFIPTDYGLSVFQNNYDNLKQSFPFNTYFELTGAIQDAVSSTTMTTTNTIGIPFVKTTAGHAQYYVAPVLSSSSLPNAISGTNANLVRNTLSYLFWLIAGAIAVILFIKF